MSKLSQVWSGVSLYGQWICIQASAGVSVVCACSFFSSLLSLDMAVRPEVQCEW